MRNISLANQNLTLVCYDLAIQCLYPIFHCHRIHFQCLELGKVQETGNKQIQTLEFNRSQIVLSDLYVIFSYIVPLEVRHAYKRLFIVHAIVYHFGSSILMNCIMQFVLYGGKEHLCHLIAWIIIRSRSINIGDLLIKIALATTNIPNALQQLTEIAVTPLL